MIPYKAKSGAQQYKPELNIDIDEDDFDITGWCLACGETQNGVEPDARRYECENCSAKKVYGLAELALMGLVV